MSAPPTGAINGSQSSTTSTLHLVSGRTRPFLSEDAPSQAQSPPKRTAANNNMTGRSRVVADTSASTGGGASLSGGGDSGFVGDRAPKSSIPVISTGQHRTATSSSGKDGKGLANAWEAARPGGVSFFVPARRAYELVAHNIFSPLVDAAAVQELAARHHQTRAGGGGSSNTHSLAGSFASVAHSVVTTTTTTTATGGGGATTHVQRQAQAGDPVAEAAMMEGTMSGPTTGRRRSVVLNNGMETSTCVVMQNDDLFRPGRPSPAVPAAGTTADLIQDGHCATIGNATAATAAAASAVVREFGHPGAMAGVAVPMVAAAPAGPTLVTPSGAQTLVAHRLPDTSYVPATDANAAEPTPSGLRKRRQHHAVQALDTNAPILTEGLVNGTIAPSVMGPVPVVASGTGGAGGQRSTRSSFAGGGGANEARPLLGQRVDVDGGRRDGGETRYSMTGGGGGDDDDDDNDGNGHVGVRASTVGGARSVHAETVFHIPGVDEHLLDELRATSIAGNDISSSCLYATGIVASAAGKYAPIASAIVCLVLFLFRGIYSEVFSALPMNGGTYSALLNVATKNWASLAAILSTLSYTATAVTSAASAADYLSYGWPQIPSEPVCCSVLAFFALLTLMGMKDSANTATALFLFHLLTMATLIVSSLVYVIRDGGDTLSKSWHSPTSAAMPYSNVIACLFFGYSSALLGVTGFESSANYIEEQKPGVFPKTLRNMWIVITAINPAIAVLAMGVIPIEELVANANYSLAYIADRTIGGWFKTVVIIDAFLVLSGAVLTAYVGITGMHRRLALDRIMPDFFLWTNPWRHTNHVIILSFCALTISLRLLVSDMNTLGGVYAIAFLGVMILFCVSNLMLKWKRSTLPRTPIVNPLVVLGGMAAVTAGLVGNLIKSPDNAEYFLFYFIFFAAIVLITKMRITVLRFISRLFPSGGRVGSCLRTQVHRIRDFPIVFFTNSCSLNTLNKVVQYVKENEDTSILKIMHCFDSETVLVADPDTGTEQVVCVDPNEQEFMDRLEFECAIIDRLYPKLTIELVFVNSPFSPLTVDEISREMNIPKNYMFITCPGSAFPHQIGHFGGIRVITH